MMNLPLIFQIGFGIILLGLLIWLSVIDFQTYRIPNSLNLTLGLTGLVFSELTIGLLHSLIGCIVGYTFFVSIELAFKKFRGIDGLGRGDAKLLAAGGAWCGWMGLPYIILFASLFGIIASLLPIFKMNKNGWIAFGPFLALGIFVVWTSQRLAGL